MHLRRVLVALIFTILFATGCTSKDGGAHRLSGKVTFDGKSVPAGKVILLPDTSKGGSGQGGWADITDGAFDTSKKGQGTMGGPMIVRIDGFDGVSTPNAPLGRRLFMTHDILVDLPRENSTKDFDVPASAGKNLPKVTGEPP